MRIPRRLLLSALLAVACATTPRPTESTAVQTPPPPADARRELLAALERELQPLPTRALQGPEGRFSAQVESAGAAVLEDEQDFTVVDLPIGTEAAIKCFLYRDSIDVGQSLQAMIQQLSSELQVEALRPVEIIAAGDRPAIFMELDYTTPTPDGQRAAGQVKILASPHDDLPLVCFHDELGYRRTFRRITQGFAASLQPSGNRPRVSELQVFKVRELPVGFEQRRIWEAEHGQTIVEITAVLLIPRSRTEFAFQDNVSTEISDAGGRINQYVYAKAVDGQLVLQATLERKSGNVYSVHGTRDGKPFEGSLKSRDKAGLASELLNQKEVASALLGGLKPALSFEIYSPGIHPTALQKVHYRKTPASPRSISIQLDDVTMEGELNPDGSVVRMDVPLGQGATMTQSRILAQGTP